MSNTTTPEMRAFITELADALGLAPEHPYSQTDILRHICRSTVMPIRIPRAEAPAVECVRAVFALRSSVTAARPFDMDPHIRHACAEILAALLSGRDYDTDSASITLLRAQAREIQDRFRAAGWSVVAGGVSNSPPHTGDNELWSVSTCPTRG